MAVRAQNFALSEFCLQIGIAQLGPDRSSACPSPPEIEQSRMLLLRVDVVQIETSRVCFRTPCAAATIPIVPDDLHLLVAQSDLPTHMPFRIWRFLLAVPKGIAHDSSCCAQAICYLLLTQPLLAKTFDLFCHFHFTLYVGAQDGYYVPTVLTLPASAKPGLAV